MLMLHATLRRSHARKNRLRLLQRAKKKVSCTHNICIDRDRQALAQSVGPVSLCGASRPHCSATDSVPARQNAARRPCSDLETPEAGLGGGILEAPKLPRAGVLQRWRGPTLDRCGHVTKKPSTQMHGVTHHPAAVVRDPWMRSKIPEQTIADPSVLGRIMSVFAVVFRLVESTQALSSLSSARTLCMADHEVAAGFWRQTMTATPTSGAAANCRHSVLVLVVCPEPRAKRRGEGKRDSDALSGAGLIAYCMSCMREPRLMATASSAGIEASKGRCNKGHHKAASFGPSELKGDGAAATPAEKHSSRLCTQKKR
ncbi:hypothetical protein TrVGV298_001635 [Trichoderma virens]|nr:hypothetical protein TrVGV298_001635 [Trichoderma virens]